MKTVGISDGLGGEPANDANECEWESKRFDAPFREVRRGEAQGAKASSRHVSHRRLPKPSLLEACELVHRFSHLTNQFSLLTRHPGGAHGSDAPYPSVLLHVGESAFGFAGARLWKAVGQGLIKSAARFGRLSGPNLRHSQVKKRIRVQRPFPGALLQ